jgi:CheY-like chemotaxis protein
MTGDFDSLFADEDDTQEPLGEPWKVLIVDDEPQIFQATKLALDGMVYAGRPIEFLAAGSGNEAMEMIRRHNDIAVILLDIVMDTEDDGFRVVDFVRKELQNGLVRIVIRTGQPGQHTEKKVMLDYEISDYKEKTELTSTKLSTTLISSLRNYQELKKLQGNVDRYQSTLNDALVATEKLSQSLDKSPNEGPADKGASVLLSMGELDLLRSVLTDLKTSLKDGLQTED